jgi:hypothetical protein
VGTCRGRGSSRTPTLLRGAHCTAVGLMPSLTLCSGAVGPRGRALLCRVQADRVHAAVRRGGRGPLCAVCSADVVCVCVCVCLPPSHCAAGGCVRLQHAVGSISVREALCCLSVLCGGSAADKVRLCVCRWCFSPPRVAAVDAAATSTVVPASRLMVCSSCCTPAVASPRRLSDRIYTASIG